MPSRTKQVATHRQGTHLRQDSPPWARAHRSGASQRSYPRMRLQGSVRQVRTLRAVRRGAHVFNACVFKLKTHAFWLRTYTAQESAVEHTCTVSHIYITAQTVLRAVELQMYCVAGLVSASSRTHSHYCLNFAVSRDAVCVPCHRACVRLPCI